MRRLFGRPVVPSATKSQETREALDQQKEESAKVLDYVKQVLQKKDELLANAVNQTGSAVRVPPKRSARHHYR